MIGVHLRHHEGNVGGHAEGAGVRDDGAARGGKLRFKLVRHRSIERGEENARQFACGVPSGVFGIRVMPAIRAGRGVSSFQRQASS